MITIVTQIKVMVSVPVETQLVGDGISNGLRIGRRARATAEDPIVDGREFIRHAVGDVSAAEITCLLDTIIKLITNS